MPRDLPVYTTCAGPGVAKDHKSLGGIVGSLIDTWYTSGPVAVALVVIFLLGTSFIPVVGPIAAGTVLIAALVQFKFWYYNERLLCIQNRDCAIGTVISSSVNLDGDAPLNIHLAPFSQAEWIETLVTHLRRNESMLTDDANFNDPPFHTSHPPTAPGGIDELASDLDKIRDYMARLRGEDPEDADRTSDMYNQILIGVVDTALSDPDKNFYERFYRKDPNNIPGGEGSDRWNAIPEDHQDIDWQQPNTRGGRGLNPMFRFDDGRLVPYLHCEIEGNRLALIIDRLIVAVVAYVIAAIVAGFLVGIVFLILISLIQVIIDWLLDTGEADVPDVDFDTPDISAPPSVTETTGDVVVVYGNWIMDEEHQQYFEIHPVRAYFIVARNIIDDDPTLVDSNEDQVSGPNFDPTQIDANRATAICDAAKRAEEEDPLPVVEIRAPEALSTGMDTRYGGGGAAIP